MAKKREQPKAKKQPQQGDNVRIAADPENYLKMTPVWRFRDFDWDGPWGLESCADRIANMRSHIEAHLSSFETMTWEEILRANGGRGEKGGNNSHPIAREKFKKEVQERLAEKQIFADDLFSLRLDAGTRVYGVRELNCLRVVFFDPYHKDHAKCAYEYDD
jgi:hypothetical protein